MAIDQPKRFENVVELLIRSVVVTDDEFELREEPVHEDFRLCRTDVERTVACVGDNGSVGCSGEDGCSEMTFLSILL